MTTPTVTALALQVSYLGLAIGWRSWRQRRRTGDWGVRVGRRPGGPVRERADDPRGVGVVRGVRTSSCLGTIALIGGWRDDTTPVAGLVVMAVGVAGVVASQLGLRDSWRIGVDVQERTRLVVDGPNALARNPIFTGMAVVGIGTGLAVPTWLGVAGAVLTVAGVELQVRRVEEPYLLAAHGASYREYAARVGRFVPWFGRLGAGPLPRAA